jgi:surface carbohydrate biosynthesis protein
MLRNIFKNILKIKFNSSNLKKNKIVLYRSSFLEILNSRINSKIIVLDLKKEIYFALLLKVFFFYGFKKIKQNYIREFLTLVDPDIFITFIDNDINFYNQKKYFSKINFIVVQNGIRGGVRLRGEDNSNKIFEDQISIKNKIKIDSIYYLNEITKDRYSNYIESKSSILGSFKSNLINPKMDKKKIIINFISQFVDVDKKYFKYRYTNIYWADFYEAEKKALILLAKFCQNKNIKLQILPRTQSDKEYKFFKNILKNNFKFIFKKKDDVFSNYLEIDQSILNVGIDSTLNYESLSRKNKTIFLSLRNNLMSEKYPMHIFDEFNFGWPLDLSQRGLFWSNIYDIKVINDIFENVLSLSEQEWNKEISKVQYKKILFPTNNNNKLLFDNLKDLKVKLK